MSKELKIIISPDGSSVEVDAEGFQGAGCMDYAKKIQVAIGDAQDSGKKPEFFQESHDGISTGLK